MKSEKHYSKLILLIIVMLCGTLGSCRKDFQLKQNASEYAKEEEDSRPNIIIIVGDDIGYEIPTCNGGQSYSTPNIDYMARNGVRFTQGHALPLCTPTRVSLLTGKYNFRNYTEFGYLTPTQKTLGNMFSDAGYATCYTGKWQLDGGDNSIRGFGWQKYRVWLPFLLDREYMEGNRYKSAKIYQDGGYLPSGFSLNQYTDDLTESYMLSFIDSVHNLHQPFFAYHSMILCHGPFCPTPDDPEYKTWDYSGQKSNAIFFPSMVKYMDKKIGEIINHLREKGMLENTVIFYLGDNGTAPGITSTWNGGSVTGGKKQTNELGTNIPLLCLWQGNIAANKVSNALISCTDFFPTLSDLTDVPMPQTYGTLDGVSFYPALVSNDTSALRENIFASYCIAPINHPWRRWVQNDSYKLYDTNINKRNYQFVKIAKCQPDSPPLKTLTPAEKALKNEFIQVLRYYDTH